MLISPQQFAHSHFLYTYHTVCSKTGPSATYRPPSATDRPPCGFYLRLMSPSSSQIYLAHLSFHLIRSVVSVLPLALRLRLRVGWAAYFVLAPSPCVLKPGVSLLQCLMFASSDNTFTANIQRHLNFLRKQLAQVRFLEPSCVCFGLTNRRIQERF